MPSINGNDIRETYEIKNRITGAVLFTASITCPPDTPPGVKLGLAVKEAAEAGVNLTGANLTGVNLTGANLTGVNLTGAYLGGVNLTDANLGGANLARAYLGGANLARANLTGVNLTDANLTGAKGVQPEKVTHLASFKFMPGPLHAFKVVTGEGEGHIQGGLKYEIGKQVEVSDADTSTDEACSRGIHVADLPWCLREWREGYRILVVEHTAEDIAAVPLGTDGKYRLFRCTPVEDITDKLRACGALPTVTA